ncbi:MAG: efflux RND transporter permease subunit, partial [Chloroflexota bacterium]
HFLIIRVTPLAAALFLASLMGCASALNPPSEADISDPGILASIETQLKAKKGLDLRTVTVNVNARVVTISGLAASYNILLVDLANQLWRGGATREEAVKKACLVRLRPILMTSLAAILGLVPMSLHTGEAGMPLARAMIGGLLGAKIMTLVLTPALYRLLKPSLSKEDPYATV